MTDAPTHRRTDDTDISDWDADDALKSGATPSVIIEGGRGKYGRRACFTLNNWTEPERQALLKDFKLYANGWCFGEECGKKKSIPHLQGYVEFHSERAFNSVNKIVGRARWSTAVKCKLANVRYCRKGKNVNEYWEEKKGISKAPTIRDEELKKARSEYDNVVWRPWQEWVVYLRSTNPTDDRSIYWIWEPKGNVGKSFLYKYFAINFPVVIAEGKASDVFNQVNTYLDRPLPEDYTHTTVLVNIPRSVHQEWVSYQAIERIKDGALYSGKYEGGVCILAKVHVFVFANEPPKWKEFSSDRWQVYEIVDQQLVQTEEPVDHPSGIKSSEFYN